MKHIVLAAFIASSFAFAQDKPAPDNTKTNQRDRAGGKMTADQQKMNPTDRELSQKIRKRFQRQIFVSFVDLTSVVLHLAIAPPEPSVRKIRVKFVAIIFNRGRFCREGQPNRVERFRET